MCLLLIIYIRKFYAMTYFLKTTTLKSWLFITGDFFVWETVLFRAYDRFINCNTVQKRKKYKKKENGDDKSKKSKKKGGGDEEQMNVSNEQSMKTNKKSKGGSNPLKPEDYTDEYIDKLIK